MASKDRAHDFKEGSLMAGKKKVVTLRPKGDRKPKDISEEPEMKRLKKLLDEGKISQDRLDRYLKTGKEDREEN